MLGDDYNNVVLALCESAKATGTTAQSYTTTITTAEQQLQQYKDILQQQ